MVSLAKGLEEGSLLRPCEVLAEVLPGRSLGSLSGPSHAEEVISGQPAGLARAGDEIVGHHVQRLLHGDGLRILHHQRSGRR